MYGDRLLKMATILIVIGTVGLFGMAWVGGSSVFSGGMRAMMMGKGGMHRDGMNEVMNEMMSGRLPPGIKAENLPDRRSTGAKLLNSYCTQCHNLPSPLMHTAEEWPTVEVRMFSRIQMMGSMRGMMGGRRMRGMMDIRVPSKEEEAAILSYLQKHALKPATVETLGPLDTPGLSLFRQTCSQCHALPDPTLHMADEWADIVVRMQKNMEIMGKPVITDQEGDEIAEYLSKHSR